ncbi:putative secreted Zn-dependent protease [Actinoplanes campanulatus]|uniref:Putative secreted Zn-dependent protease n=1 Tax=Actinoplanes campanulatus TaxID=113559 RepID=A0A7W5AP81_9ACTN|nr:DUF397 domain-containing protein [Actinoplanes campanulatus]MBB3099434.1 putative secreted Zn-dependent protease [Actinoplanes campanulatus]GGN39989.1 hypothetical protein GCM10010109_68510 [Actinoplanes campanulatus]
MTDLSNLPWKKSTRSSGNGACVEVAITADGIYVRDTKDRTLPPHKFNFKEWDAFVGGVKDGEFDL